MSQLGPQGSDILPVPSPGQPNGFFLPVFQVILKHSPSLGAQKSLEKAPEGVRSQALRNPNRACPERPCAPDCRALL